MIIKHKGFTFIELVILSVIIGTLSTVMFFMNKNAQSTSRANHIISDFRNLKTAALLWRNENGAKIREGGHYSRDILSYLNSKAPVKLAEDIEDNDSYILHVTDGGKSWYIGRGLRDTKIMGKLTASSGNIKLLGSDKKSPYNNDSEVWVQVL